MKVTLLHNTPLWVNAVGARTCWDSHGKSDTGLSTEICGERDRELIDRVGNKFKHQSILEHVSYNFYIDGISRACLQELARHRMASLSVKSTRYTLKELKEEKSFMYYECPYEHADAEERAKKYLVKTNDIMVDMFNVLALDNLRKALKAGTSNDIAKYCLPEAYKTELTWTINMRSLQNFLSLRSDKSALWEIRNLANTIYEALPEDHKYMYDGYMKSVEHGEKVLEQIKLIEEASKPSENGKVFVVTKEMRTLHYNETGRMTKDAEIAKWWIKRNKDNM